MYAWTSAAGAGWANAKARVGKGIYVSGTSGKMATINFNVYRHGLIYAAGSGSSYKIRGYIVDSSTGNRINSTVIASASRSAAVPAVSYSGDVSRGFQVWLSPGKKYKLYVELETESEAWGTSVWT